MGSTTGIDGRKSRPIRIYVSPNKWLGIEQLTSNAAGKGASGSVLDRRHAFKQAVSTDEQIDLITGDWMSEGNMTSSALRKLQIGNLGGAVSYGYEESFLITLSTALDGIARRRIKVAVNAGASDTELLCRKVEDLVKSKGHSLKVAWISGDEVLDIIQDKFKAGKNCLVDVSSGAQVNQLPAKAIYAQAYLGGRGIAEAFRNGADIVICGRVADASLVMGGAMWWHGWNDTQYHELANALIAGHLIECSTYVTGGNFSGFKSVPNKENLGFPIAEIGRDGDVIITKLASTGGVVTRDTVTAQLLYEIQGPCYLNSDVGALLEKIHLQELGPDRIKVSGVAGIPPPPTTKVGVTIMGGYQAEMHWSLVGLDIEAKAKLLERNIKDSLGPDLIAGLSLIQFTTYGVAADNPASQSESTVDFRVFVQAPEVNTLSRQSWIEPVLNVIMCSYPGATPHPASITGLPRAYCEFEVYLMPQSLLKHQAHLESRTIDIPAPSETQKYPTSQQSYDPDTPAHLGRFGRTIRGPIGWVVHARSGDKGANANVGFWVRSDEEYAWLRSLLTISRVKELLGNEYKTGEKVERFEIPGLQAVHFLLHNHLDRGINSTSSYDILGKNVAEYLRARHVDIPLKFLLLAGKI